jgi:KRI1-like family
VRRVDDSRKRQREARKARKAEEKAEKMRELERLKTLKKQEVFEKLQKLKQVAGGDRAAPACTLVLLVLTSLFPCRCDVGQTRLGSRL